MADLDLVRFQDRYGPRALVCGGAQGLGAEYCRQLAAAGLDLIVVDRDPEALEQTVREVRDTSDVDVRSAVIDLAQPAPALLSAIGAATRGLDVGLLVLNAARSPVGHFLDLGLDTALTTLDLNCRTPMVLAHALGRAMRDRGRGGIIFMSSLAAEAGNANVALYSATKAFDLILAEGLWYELRGHGIDVLAVRPGSTRTPGWEATQPPDGEIPGVMAPGPVVAEALAALGTMPTLVPGEENRAAEAFFRAMSRQEIIEMMSGITDRLRPHGHE